MMVPTIHLNGTSQDSLLNSIKDAHQAIETALEKLALAAPHARDYYVQDGDAFNQAAKEHRARVEALSAVQAELFAMWEAILNQK